MNQKLPRAKQPNRPNETAEDRRRQDMIRKYGQGIDDKGNVVGAWWGPQRGTPEG